MIETMVICIKKRCKSKDDSKIVKVHVWANGFLVFHLSCGHMRRFRLMEDDRQNDIDQTITALVSSEGSDK